MKKKVILNSVTHFSTYNFRLSLVKELQEKGFDVVALGKADDYTQKLEKIGVKCIDSKICIGGINPIIELGFIFRLFFIFLREKPLLVHHFTPKCVIFGSIASKLAGVKTICSISGLGHAFCLEKHNPIRLISTFLYYISNLFTNYYIFMNTDDLNFFLNSKITSKRKTKLIPGSGVDLSYFKKPEDNTPPTSPLVFTFIGRLLLEKGIIDFLEAAKIIHDQTPSAQFRVIGDIAYDNPSLINKKILDDYLMKNKSLTYVGKVSDVRPQLLETSVLVLPSYREGLPLSVLEAMAFARPIITTDTPGCNMPVRHNFNGFLTPLKSPEMIAKYMGHFIENPQDLKKMGENSYQRVVNEFESSIIVSELLHSYSQILPIDFTLQKTQ